MTLRSWFFVWLVAVSSAATLRAVQLREFETRHYAVHTDLDPSLASDLTRRLDAMYDEYDQRLSVFSGKMAIPRLRVYLFSRHEDYTAFTDNRMQNSGGAFLPNQNLLIAFLGDQGRDQLRRTLQHEAFHQFAYNAIGPDLPPWLNEGLAQFFEEGLWNGGEFLLGEVPPRRLRQLKSDLDAGRLVDFDTLLHMTNDQWTRRLADSRADGATQYNQSWAMVHFLAMDQDARGRYRYRPRLLDLLRLIHEGHAADDAFRLAFGNNVRGFHDRFVEYVRTLGASPEATLIENQGVLADLLINFDRDGKRFGDVASFRRYVLRGHYRLHYSRGDMSWDTAPDPARYFRDPGGKPFDSDQLHFSPAADARLPDIVCRCGSRIVLRTRFHDTDRGTEHELLIEPASRAAAISN